MGVPHQTPLRLDVLSGRCVDYDKRFWPPPYCNKLRALARKNPDGEAVLFRNVTASMEAARTNGVCVSNLRSKKLGELGATP
jgi:hypothetical protein